MIKGSELGIPEIWESPKGERVMIFDDNYVKFETALPPRRREEIETMAMSRYRRYANSKEHKTRHMRDVFKEMGWTCRQKTLRP